MKSNQSKAPVETAIPLLEPVRIYTAKELAAMPLSKMNEAIAAQEAYYIMEHTTKMGGAGDSGPPAAAKWCFAYPGQRKIQNTLQGQRRIYRASNYPPAGKARFSEAERLM